MSLSIQTVAQEFSLSEEALTRESLRAYLLEQLHTLDVERQARCAKFGVTSLTEMDELLQRGEVSEESILEVNDGSYIDFWWSTQIPGRYAYHWERRHVDGTIYRHDNMPHPQWQGVQSFPQHFHTGDQDTVLASTLTADPEQALREFLLFAARKIAEEGRG